MNDRIVTILLMVALVWSASAMAAGDIIYRWTDENGTVVFGETPPEGVDSKPVNVNAPMMDTETVQPAATEDTASPDLFTDPAATDTEEDLSPAEQSRRERTERRETAAAEQAEIEITCQAMQQQLEWVEPRTRVLITEPDGTTRQLDDNERMAKVKESKDYIAKHDCK